MNQVGPSTTVAKMRRLKWMSVSTVAATVMVTALLLSGCGSVTTNTAEQQNTAKSSAVGGSPAHTHVLKSVTTKTSATKTVTTKTSTAQSQPSPSAAQWIASPLNYEPIKAVTVNSHLFVPVLMYHDITYLPKNSLGMSATQFDGEMTWLSKHGFHPINLGQLYGAFYHGYKLPYHPIVITFDDGYKSVYTNAFPELKKYHFQATVFIVTGAVGRTTGFPELSWNDLQTMESSGLIDVESHTVHHIALSLASPAVQQAELVDSAKTLQAQLHHPTLYFCYPSSNYDQQTMRDLKTDGYLLAFTEHPGYANINQGPYQLHRVRMWEGMPLQDFAAALAGD